MQIFFLFLKLFLKHKEEGGIFTQNTRLLVLIFSNKLRGLFVWKT